MNIIAKPTPFRLSGIPALRFAHDHRWGPWALDAHRLCLCRIRDGETDIEHSVYEIDLEEITGPFWLIDWLCQIEGKTWATPEVLGHLTRALIQLFRPRSSMRPPATGFDPVAVMKQRIDFGASSDE